MECTISWPTFGPEDRITISKLRGCPVNNRVYTKMSREAFIKSCLRYQQTRTDSNGNTRIPTDKNGKYRASTISICSTCKIGKKVREGKSFDPPYNMEFDELKDQQRSPRSKVTLAEEYEIRLLASKKKSAREIKELLKSRLSLRTIRRVISGL